MTLRLQLIVLFACVFTSLHAQEIELFEQFNGRYNYTAIGNTLNAFENNLADDYCETLLSSEAVLNLLTNATVHKAYLYWAGSGEGDTQVVLNGTYINATDIYTVNYDDANFGPLTYFSCYADITDFIEQNGNINYEFSELDISETLTNNTGYCGNRTNFAGWAIYIIYEDQDLPLNQINLYQGLDIINRDINEKTIALENLNVLDNTGAKIGFLAWEGDNALNYGESLSINGNILSNPPLNAADNAFNGTNTFTNSSELYNMDLDVYDIENNISVGDSEATIMLTTGDYDENGTFQADLIILNNVITVLNSQLPDATIAFEPFLECNNRTMEVDYTVFNTNSTDPLPAGVPISFYINGEWVFETQTQTELPIDGMEEGTISITVDESIGDSFTLTAIVDDPHSINETNEDNNGFEMEIDLITVPPLIELPELEACDIGYDTAPFDLTEMETEINLSAYTAWEYYETIDDVHSGTNEILIPEDYQNTTDPQFIYIKLYTDNCYEIAQFTLTTKNCPPWVPQAFSPNDDGYNDWFNIQGLYTIFDQHELQIYNRYGFMVFKGNDDLRWYGRANRGTSKGKIVPVGTYYYVIHLNDPDYNRPLVGWVYVNY